ncbi:MAG TPA: ribosome biogenesis GTPase Der [Candidatus Manganitrophaceae bacterium]|nr:ribosome biogenesis GTPase Der [Candidatus Manganitrophaceae bacterium]
MGELKRPVVSIVGRPNVGKSTLFNKLVGKRKAIVQDEPGITRDRNEALCRYRDRQFTLIDTGGLLLHSKEPLAEQVRKQSEIAIEQSDYILFLMDAREGITPVDREVHDLLRKSGKPIYYVINKTEGKGAEGLNEFYELGVSPLYPISSEHNRGLSDLLDALYPHLAPEEEEEQVTAPRVVVLGRPNVGKSTLINAILKEERLVTSDIPGTTRDTIDTWVTYGDKRYLFIDTAGIRKRGKIGYGVEQYSVSRAKTALEKSDIALLVLDGEEGITEQDTKIAGMIIDEGRGAILLVNKSDRLKEGKERIQTQLSVRFPFIHDPQLAFISALEETGLERVFEKIDSVYKGMHTRITTGDLNRFFEKVSESHPPPIYKGRPIRLYYITQAGVRPPTFILFANAPAGVPEHYLRYIENQLRAAFDFTGAPIRLIVRQRK